MSVKSAKKKTCLDLAYAAGMEKTRIKLLIDKLEITSEYLGAQAKYFDKLAMIEEANELFGFDLDIL